MYDLRIRYLASVFTDAGSVVATPALSHDLLEALDDDRLVPLTAFEDVSGTRTPRLSYHAPEEGWRLMLTSKRFDVSLHPLDASGSNFVPFSDFCEEASEKLCRMIEYFERRGHRLAGVREGLLPEMDEEELIAINRRLMLLPSPFAETPPFEWDWRAVSLVDRTFGGTTEPTNTIATAKRLIANLEEPNREPKTFDRIRVDLDINTTPLHSVKARFGSSEVDSFFSAMPEWQEELGAGFHSFLRGEQE